MHAGAALNRPVRDGWCWRCADFLDPTAIDVTTANPYFPLIPGSFRVYQGVDERITVTVSSRTKRIPQGAAGVNCLEVHDLVEEIDLAELTDGKIFTTLDGQPVEDTDDWYGQNLAGDVWYCGEISSFTVTSQRLMNREATDSTFRSRPAAKRRSSPRKYACAAAT